VICLIAAKLLYQEFEVSSAIITSVMVIAISLCFLLLLFFGQFTLKCHILLHLKHAPLTFFLSFGLPFHFFLNFLGLPLNVGACEVCA
jgi:hypothetical protein